MRTAALALAFGLELVVYVAAAWWGFSLDPRWTAVLVGLGLPVLLAVGWGLFASPKASRPLHGPSLVGFETLWYGMGVACILALGHRGWALTFALVLLANLAVLRLSGG